MGASGWLYFAPYQVDVNAALQALRQQIFERGNYQHMGDLLEPDLEELRFQFGEQIGDLMYQGMKAAFDAQTSDAPPETIDDLLEQAAEDGTHSILDTPSIAPAGNGFAELHPLSTQQKQTLFGTEKPTQAQVRAVETDLLNLVPMRWSGFYFEVYEGDTPVEWCFAGVSGD
jgi:hypothetical protein